VRARTMDEDGECAAKLHGKCVFAEYRRSDRGHRGGEECFGNISKRNETGESGGPSARLARRVERGLIYGER